MREEKVGEGRGGCNRGVRNDCQPPPPPHPPTRPRPYSFEGLFANQALSLAVIHSVWRTSSITAHLLGGVINLRKNDARWRAIVESLSVSHVFLEFCR